MRECHSAPERARLRRVCSLNRRRRPFASSAWSLAPFIGRPSRSSALRQLLEDSNQLRFGREIYLDSAARSAAYDADTRAEQELQLLFRRARVDIDWGGRRLSRR